MKSSSVVDNLFFDKKELFIGIDVHKAKWAVTTRTYDLELKSFSMKPVAEELERFLFTNYPGADYQIVYECCFTGFWIYDYFFEKGYKIIVTPTNRIYKDGSTIKTDKIDSRKLAFQLSRGLLREVMVPERTVREYRYIFRFYDKQKMRKGQILRQIKAVLEQKNHPLKWEKWNKGLVEKLKGLTFEGELFNLKFRNLLNEYEFVVNQIKDSEEIIGKMKEDEQIGGRITRIEKISGIGIISAARMSVYLFDRKDRFESSEKLSHYLGLTPTERSSGEKVIRGRSGMYGNKQLRSIVIQLAWITVRKDGSLLDKFERVYKRSGSKQKAIVAVARKLMTKIFAIISKEEDYKVNLNNSRTVKAA
ncbi:MAG: IS110 family transposase [Ignavibacteriaceae bacterium]|nr:IS110 family transposase [Ignavibacteriaceae bacterium]